VVNELVQYYFRNLMSTFRVGLPANSLRERTKLAVENSKAEFDASKTASEKALYEKM